VQSGITQRRTSARNLPLVVEGYTSQILPVNISYNVSIPYTKAKIEILFTIQKSEINFYDVFLNGWKHMEVRGLSNETDYDGFTVVKFELYVFFNNHFVCNAIEFYELVDFGGYDEYGDIASLFNVSVIQDRLTGDTLKRIPAHLIKSSGGRCNLTLVINVSFETYRGELPNCYFKYEIYKFYCVLKPRDADVDGIYDAVDLLLGLNNIFAILIFGISGAPISIFVEKKALKIARKVKSKRSKR